MIPVPMLALAVSPEDKQIRKIVTLDYPTGQNSVAIISGLGQVSGYTQNPTYRGTISVTFAAG